MALFTTLKRALGFGPSEFEDDESEGIDARVTKLQKRDGESFNCATHAEGTISSCDSGKGGEPVGGGTSEGNNGEEAIVPAAIFETVVKIFNESLPDFIRESVDEKTQRDYIYAALDASMRDYMEHLAVDARLKCDARWENERRNLNVQLDQLRRQSQKCEEDSSDSRKQQLSAERQKRALGERVHDLERQLAAAQAENEQYILENKSLINKIRLTTVLGGADVANADEALVAKISELSAQYEALQAETASVKGTARIAEEKVAHLTAENNDLKAENTAHKKELVSLREALEQSRVKDDLGDAMLTELNTKLAVAVETERSTAQQLADKETEVEHLLREIESVKREYANLKTSHDATAEQLAEAVENLSVVEQLHRQLTSLEESRHANETFLRKQKEEIAQKDRQLHMLEIEKRECAETLRKKEEAMRALEDVADNLRQTIETNLYKHAQAESALRSEIERIKTDRSFTDSHGCASAAEPAASYGETAASDFEVADSPHAGKSKKGKGQRKSKLKISAIDETLEDTDWLISTPPPSKRKKEPEADDKIDFGYKEPARKAAPDNPAQMSLW